MTVSGGNAVQNSAYRSGITCGLQVREDLKAFNFCCERSFALLRSGFRLQAHACIPPQLAALIIGDDGEGFQNSRLLLLHLRFSAFICGDRS